MIYKLADAAKDDLIRIHQYGTKQFGERQADKYFDAFFEQFQLIANDPFLYPSVDHIRKGYRRCICGVDSIYFRLFSGQVEIMRIIGRQGNF